MPIIDDKGRIFGIINILDLAILTFVFILVLSSLLYNKFPPQLKEHRNVTFQMYFSDVPAAIGQQVFVPGMPLIATYAKSDKAVITAMQEIINSVNGKTDFLITINASLEVDVDGDILFNGNDVAPGNLHDVQIGNSYLQGKIWRVGYNYSIETRKVMVKVTVLSYEDYPLKPSLGDIVFDRSGNEIGTVLYHTEAYTETHKVQYTTLSLYSDVYDGHFFVSESPLERFFPFYFIIDNQTYKGSIAGVSS